MNELNTRIELEALIVEGDGMRAENLHRLHCGNTVAYGDTQFNELAQRMRKLKSPEPSPAVDEDSMYGSAIVAIEFALNGNPAARNLFLPAINLLETAQRNIWNPQDAATTALSRFDEATCELRATCERFKNDWVWQERLAAVDIARALLAAKEGAR